MCARGREGFGEIRVVIVLCYCSYNVQANNAQCSPAGEHPSPPSLTCISRFLAAASMCCCINLGFIGEKKAEQSGFSVDVI